MLAGEEKRDDPGENPDGNKKGKKKDLEPSRSAQVTGKKGRCSIKRECLESRGPQEGRDG